MNTEQTQIRKMKNRTNENDELNGEQAAEEPRAAEPKQTPQHPDLSGLYFISFQPMGRAEYRGRVESAVNGLLLIELYDWEDGQPIEKRLIRIDEAQWNDIMRSGWKFFSDRDSWEEASRDEEEETEKS
jgi:hypothetical protein